MDQKQKTIVDVPENTDIPEPAGIKEGGNQESESKSDPQEVIPQQQATEKVHKPKKISKKKRNFAAMLGGTTVGGSTGIIGGGPVQTPFGCIPQQINM